MSDTLNNISLPINDYVDLNTVSGIAVGTGMIIQNLGNEPIKLIAKTTGTPTQNDGYNVIQGADKINSWFEVSAGEPTIWALAEKGSSINVQEA